MSASSETQVRFLSSVAVWSVIANAVLAVAVIVLASAYLSKKIEAYAMSDSGQAIRMVPLTDEYLTESRVNAFTSECMRQAFEHDFEHYRRTVQAATSCFTGSGVDSYIGQITPLTDAISRRRMVMSVTVDPPVVVRKGARAGVYECEVQTNVTVFMIGLNERIPPSHYTATIGLRRISLSENVRGVGMTFINLKPRASSAP